MAKLHLFSDTAKQIGYYLPRNISFVIFFSKLAKTEHGHPVGAVHSTHF
jgi:hypothetical protein